METNFPINHPAAIKLWSMSTAVEIPKLQYFSKWMSERDDSVFKVQRELQKKKGEMITVHLRMKLTGDGAEGDDPIEGTTYEENINYFNDTLYVNQRRKGTLSRGRMSEQRVPYNMRKDGRDALTTWWAEDIDEQMMMYLAGARGIDTSFHAPLNWTGRAGNPLQVPSATRIFYGGNATGKADLDANDKMDLGIVDKCVAFTETTDPAMLPLLVDGERKFILLMHIYQAYDLRNSVSDNDWIDIHKNTDGKDSVIYKNSLGEFNGIVLHKHRNVIRFNDYGAGGNVAAARALLLGGSAGIVAWGGDGGETRYTWHEETYDRGNGLSITAGTILGIKKSRYNGVDFGCAAIDTAATSPVPV